MKVLNILMLASVALGNVMKGMSMDTTATPPATNTTGGAKCGIGYTYCGYILKHEKHFDESTILTAYCAAGLCDSASGTTKTDHLQALFVCLPETAIPKKESWDASDDEPYTGPVKIEMLCACSGKPFGGGKNVCLNPDGDHIGRCSQPCQNVGS